MSIVFKLYLDTIEMNALGVESKLGFMIFKKLTLFGLHCDLKEPIRVCD